MSTTQNASRSAMPAASATSLYRLVDAELSMPSRLGYIALLLAALTMTGVVGTLWATEPSLPTRAHVAFGLMVAIGASWIVFALWVLTHRRILFARHNIVAGRMAVAFTAVFLASALGMGYATGRSEAYKAAVVGVLMLGASVAVLVRAHRAFARLASRRDALERELGKGSR